jgi:hypothetical protein
LESLVSVQAYRRYDTGKIDERSAANMDVVLEEVCRELPHGATMNFASNIAQKLLQGVKKGNVTLDGLRNVASRALSEPNLKSA